MCWDQPLKRIRAASTLGKPQKLSSSWNRSRSQTKVVRFFQSTHATIGLSLPSLALLKFNTVIYVEFGYLRGTFHVIIVGSVGGCQTYRDSHEMSSQLDYPPGISNRLPYEVKILHVFLEPDTRVANSSQR